MADDSTRISELTHHVSTDADFRLVVEDLTDPGVPETGYFDQDDLDQVIEDVVTKPLVDSLLDLEEDEFYGRPSGGSPGGVSSANVLNALLDNVIPANTGLRLPNSFDASGEYAGLLEAGVSGEPGSAGMWSQQKSDGLWWNTNAGTSPGAMGRVALNLTGASASGLNILLLLQGNYRNDDIYKNAVGAALYLSTAAGSASIVAPSGSGNVVRQVAYMIGTYTIHVTGETFWLTRA